MEPVAAVLVAEDDPDLRELFAMTLERAGASVVAVPDGEAAMEALGKDRFDLVVTDMWMPRVSGLDLCRRLRADPVRRTIPVLMLSAYGRLRGREEAALVGASEYLMKPLRPSQLLDKANALLGGRLAEDPPGGPLIS